LIAVLLCVSKKDYFLAKWFPFAELCLQKLKDRSSRISIFNCILQLVWVYTYRCSEAISTTHKRLDAIVKIFFPPGKKYIFPTETSFSCFISFVHIVGIRHLEYTFNSIIYYLLNIETPPTIDNISPERIIIAIKSFTFILEGSDSKFPLIVKQLASIGNASDKIEIPTSNSSKSRLLSHIEKVGDFVIKLFRILDSNFGNNILTDDKYLLKHTPTPGGAIQYTGLDVSSIVGKDKQIFHDLIRACIEVIPIFRLFPLDHEIANILWKFTINIDPDIGNESVECIQKIFKNHEQTRMVFLKAFSDFIFSIPDRASDVIRKSLSLYHSLLVLWITDLKHPDTIVIWEKMKEIEIIGIFFLCSHVTEIRKYSLAVLRSASKLFDNFLEASKSSTIYKQLQKLGPEVMSMQKSQKIDDVLESSVDFQSGKSGNSENLSDDYIISLAESERISDIHLWTKNFSFVIKRCFETCPTVMYDCFEFTFSRFYNLHQSVIAAADPSSQNSTITSKWVSKSLVPASEDMIEQWKFYLMYCCACYTDMAPRVEERSDETSQKSAREIFKLVVPLLTTEKNTIRNGVVLSLGNCNPESYRTLLAELTSAVKISITDMRSRYLKGSQKRVKKVERLRSEITHILLLSADVLRNNLSLLNEEDIITFLYSFIKELSLFLSDPDIQLEWDHQMLRYYFCGLVEKIHDFSIGSAIIPFDLKCSLFRLFEEWCGHGPKGNSMRERESRMILNVLDQVKDMRERAVLTSVMEEQRRALEFASLKAMSALCNGSIQGPESVFNYQVIFDWVHAVFKDNDYQLQSVGKSAIENLLMSNCDILSIWEEVLDFCYYHVPEYSLTKGYFLALAFVISKVSSPFEDHKLFNLILFKVGDPLLVIRFSLNNLIVEELL
jgi:hypothetical protein